MRALSDVLLHGKKERDRIAAADSLGEVGSDEATKALVIYFHDSYSGALNQAAADALAKCGESGLKALIDLHQDVKTRSLAEQVLRGLDDPLAANALENVDRQREQYLPAGVVSGIIAQNEADRHERAMRLGVDDRSVNGPPWKRLIAYAIGFAASLTLLTALRAAQLGSAGSLVKFVLAMAVFFVVTRLAGLLLRLPRGWRWW